MRPSWSMLHPALIKPTAAWAAMRRENGSTSYLGYLSLTALRRTAMSAGNTPA
jgi:hypothetical protein